MKVTLAVLGICFLTWASPGRAAVCDSTVFKPSYGPVVVSYSDVDAFSNGSVSASFDYHQGTLSMFVHSGGTEFEMTGNDTYAIHGPPPGISIPIHVAMTVHGHNDSGYYPDCTVCSHHIGEFAASISDSKGNLDSMTKCLCGDYTTGVGLDLNVMPDEEFPIRTWIYGFNGPSGIYGLTVDTQLRFTGIPSSATLTSCHGVDEMAVPARIGTWGSLKASYR